MKVAWAGLALALAACGGAPGEVVTAPGANRPESHERPSSRPDNYSPAREPTRSSQKSK